MTQKYLVDADVFIDYLQGDQRAIQFIQRNMDKITLSAIVLAELCSGVRNQEEHDTLDAFLGLFPFFPIDSEIARAGGLLRSKYGKSHGLGLADALLAATAQLHNLEMASLNVRHYPMFANLKPVYRKT